MDFKFDSENDVAWAVVKPSILSIVRTTVGTSITPLKFGTARLQKAQGCSTVGPVNPKTGAFGFYTAYGIVREADRQYAKYGFTHTSPSVNGWSGGPVLDQGSALIIGVHIAGEKDGDKVTNYGVDIRRVLVLNKVIDDVWFKVPTKEAYGNGYYGSDRGDLEWPEDDDDDDYYDDEERQYDDYYGDPGGEHDNDDDFDDEGDQRERQIWGKAVRDMNDKERAYYDKVQDRIERSSRKWAEEERGQWRAMQKGEDQAKYMKHNRKNAGWETGKADDVPELGPESDDDDEIKNDTPPLENPSAEAKVPVSAAAKKKRLLWLGPR